ncbi:hypothetical protein BDZ97DRAFT_1927771 [Flammula alnicola]|nr:hypothetical protein BDZ97DRAFT_1927771 [Flammula alnicola]
MLILARFAVLLTFSLFVRASIVTEILDAIEQAVDCASCHTLVGVLKGVALLGNTIFSDALITVCETVKAEDNDVCSGLLGEQGPIIAHDLRKISPTGPTSTKLCEAIIGLCPSPAVNKFTVPIPKAAPANPRTFTSTGKAPFQVVHFSDVHIDRSYTAQSQGWTVSTSFIYLWSCYERLKTLTPDSNGLALLPQVLPNPPYIFMSFSQLNRIISLNTIYWYKDNFWLYDSDTLQSDPNGVLPFAVEQLQAAEDAGQRAWIIAHMPPSSGDAFHDQSNYFDQIVQRYKNTIAASFMVIRTWFDEFAIAYTDYSNQTAANADSIAWIAPSLTPRAANPAFRVYDVDPDTYEIMDSRTFISDMSDSTFQTSPTWKMEYSARDTYGPAIGGWPATQSLGPAFWHKVTEAFVSNDVLFQQFISFKTRGVGVTPCTGSCKTTTICNLRALRAENNCDVVTPGLNFRRSEGIDTTQRGHADHCEGTGVRSILSNIAMKAQTMNPELLRKRLDSEEFTAIRL